MRLFTDDDAGAYFSPCRQYRYLLWRRWSDKPACVFGMLNPSTADAEWNDQTVGRCQKWAYGWGFGSLVVCNLFALCSTDPAVMLVAADPVGPENDEHIVRAVERAGLIVCAWGVHGQHRGRDAAVLRLLRGYDLHALGFTQDGQPRHPLYLRGDSKPVLWRPAR